MIALQKMRQEMLQRLFRVKQKSTKSMEIPKKRFKSIEKKLLTNLV